MCYHVIIILEYSFNFIFISIEPKFVGSYMIPDNEDRDDNKVYFFFTEKALEAENNAHAIYTRVGRLCVVRNAFLFSKFVYMTIYLLTLPLELY